jgi:hypothetical protein
MIKCALLTIWPFSDKIIKILKIVFIMHLWSIFMNKNNMFLLALIAHISFLTGNNDKPALFKNLVYTEIEVNGSKKTIEDVINSRDSEYNEILLVEVKDDGSVKSLGTIGKPRCNTPNNISEYIELLHEHKNMGGWCGTPTNILLVTKANNKHLERICTIVANFKMLQEQNDKENNALEEMIFRSL